MKILHFVRSCANDHGAYYFLKKLEDESKKYNIDHYYLAYERDSDHPNQLSLCPVMEDINLEEYVNKTVNPDVVHFHDVNSYYILGKTDKHRKFYELAFQRKCVRTLHDYSSIACPMYFTEGEKHGECQSVLSKNCIGKCLDEDIAARYSEYIESLNHYDCITYFSDDTERRINSYKKLNVKKYKMPPLIAPIPVARPSDNTIVFAGRVIPQKGVHVLIEALARMDCKDWFAYIIGTVQPLYLRQLSKLIRKFGLVDKITFLDHVSQKDLFQVYEKAKVMAFPSISHETFGMSGAEAVAAGIPVVAFQIDGIGEWLQDGINGRIVKQGDIGAYAAALNEILTDDNIYNSYHENAMKWRADLDYPGQVSSLCNMYLTL